MFHRDYKYPKNKKIVSKFDSVERVVVEWVITNPLRMAMRTKMGMAQHLEVNRKWRQEDDEWTRNEGD